MSMSIPRTGERNDTDNASGRLTLQQRRSSFFRNALDGPQTSRALTDHFLLQGQYIVDADPE